MSLIADFLVRCVVPGASLWPTRRPKCRWLLCCGAGSPTFGQVRGRDPVTEPTRPPVGEAQE